MKFGCSVVIDLMFYVPPIACGGSKWVFVGMHNFMS